MITRLLAACVAVLLFLALGAAFLEQRTKLKAAEQATKFAQEQRDATAKTLAVEKANRAEEQRRYAASEQIIAAGRRELDAARADASSAADAAARVRSQFDAAVARARRAASNPATAASGPATGDADVVPSVMFSKLVGRAKRLVDRSTEFADLADQRGIAGSICERQYDSLTQSRLR